MSDPTVPVMAVRLLESLQNPSYKLDMAQVRALVDTEFPDIAPVPTVADLDDAVMRGNNLGLEFTNGQWIERLGNDMLWHLEPIVRTVRVINKDQEYEYNFKTTAGILVKTNSVRAPEEALKRHFGLRPWVWQQWANLRLEHYLRFQESHEMDYDEVNLVNVVTFLWEYWLNDERNADFKRLFDSKPVEAQKRLVHALMSPFRVMDEIKTEWDFETSGVSVYQYTAFLGSGYTAAVAVFLLQMSVPLLILYYTVRTSKQFPAFLAQHLSSVDVAGVFGTDWNTFCIIDYVSIDKMLINLIVYAIYVIRVLPLVFITFYQTTGDMDNCNSKLNSIRNVSYLQGDDTPWMQIGFRLNLYMNSFYIAVMNCLMLFVLFLTDSTVDVILNALALEFVFNFDKEVASYSWFDYNFRFLKASVLEIYMCGELRLDWLRSDDLFCATLDIDRDEFMREVDGPLSDASQADVDTENKKWCLTARDRLWLALSKVAPQSGREEAVLQFVEAKTSFGIVDQVAQRFVKNMPSVFKRYRDLYTWSRWDKALFLAHCPAPGEPCAFEGLACNANGVVPLGAGDKAVKDDSVRFINFDPSSSLSATYRFVLQVISTIMGTLLVHNVRMVIRRRYFVQLPIRIVDGLFEIFACAFPGCSLHVH